MWKLRTLEEQHIALIGVASALGSPDPDCARGPEALAPRLAETLNAAGRDKTWRVLRPAEGGTAARGRETELLAELSEQLATAVDASIERGDFPLVIGGDHSCAVGTWRGVSRACAPRGAVGLLWIDAHLDSHTPASTHSGQLHGMPLAALLGHGAECLTGGRPVLNPRNVAVVGVRSYEPEEAELLQRLGVRVYEMEEIEHRGLGPVIEEALQIVRGDTAAWGVTIDLDSIDPADAPGVSVPETGGIRGVAMLRALEGAGRLPGFTALEIAEFNPTRDSRGKTARLVCRLVRTLLPAGEAGGPSRWIDMERRYGAHNYHPLPVVLVRGQGVYLWDESGRRYLDMMSAYSAVSAGHAHPRLVRALTEQASTLAVTSRAYHNTKLPALLRRLCELTGLDQALPMNTGAEAVETALKAARKWAYAVKRVPPERAGIIACEGNFHGRSITIVGMSSERQYRDGFGPFPAGFTRIPYGDASALAQAITPDTAAFLVEPVQGEGGIIVPPRGYLSECARICRERNVLLICDEVQTGLGRTGRLFACEHENVLPDGIILGKALGGGLLPVSAFVGRREVMQVFTPGDHGSTFGGNPLAAAVALEALQVIVDEGLPQRAETLGKYFLGRLRSLKSRAIREVRGSGLLIGLELDPAVVDARTVCERLLERGILSKDTHHTVVRFAPPLTIERPQLDWAIEQLRELLGEIDQRMLQQSDSDLVSN